ncbi:hypothetical protein H4218_002883, partial [Coemansia sp. IMI 209128]
MSYSHPSSGDTLPLYGGSNNSKSASSLAEQSAPLTTSTQDSLDILYYDASSKHRSLGGGNRWVNLLLSIPKPAFLAGLLAIFTTSYLLSLQAGDLMFINNHLGIIGAEIIVSVISLTIVTVMLYASRMRSNTRRGALLVIACLFAALYCYDHGERFEHHGFYNLLVFLAIFVPLNLAIALFYVLWCKIDNFL